MPNTNHKTDADCNVIDDECVECGVFHGDTCRECGGRGFHDAGCSDIEERADHAPPKESTDVA
jgi:hypothetical protein